MDSLLDFDTVLARSDGDREALQVVAQLFLEEFPGLLTEIRRAIGSRDAKALQHWAHNLKGAVSNFSPVCAAPLMELELMAGRGRTEGAEAFLRAAEEYLEVLSGEMLVFLVPTP